MASVFLVAMSLYSAFGLIGLLANIIQTTYMQRKKRRKTVFDVTLLSLSIADMSSAIFTLVYGLHVIIWILTKSPPIMRLPYIDVCMNISYVASMTHVIFIAMQRLVGCILPTKYEFIFFRHRFVKMLFIAWIIPCLYGFVSIFFLKTNVFFVVNSCMFVITCISLIIMYIILYFKIRKHNQGMGYGTSHHRVLFHSVLVATAFIVSFGPFAFSSLAVHNTPAQFSEWLLICDVLVPLNPFLDTVVYFYVYYSRMQRVEAVKDHRQKSRGTKGSENKGQTLSIIDLEARMSEVK